MVFTSRPLTVPPESVNFIEYIRSTGTQFLDTLIPVTSTAGFEVEFSLTTVEGMQGIIGGFNYGGYNHNFGAFNGQWLTQWGNAGEMLFGTADTERHIISQNMEPGVVSFDGETILTGLIYYDNTERTFRLCCYNGGPAYPTFWITPICIYACRIKDNGIFRDLRPCYDPNGVVCMYDLINKEYLYNQGSGDFIGGEGDENTLFLMHGNEIKDSSIYGIEIANNGVVVSNGKSKFGGTSLYIPNGAYLSARVPVSGDCTIECWVNFNSFPTPFPTPYNWAMGGYRGFYTHILQTATYPCMGNDSLALAPLTENTWHHLAQVRVGTDVLSFIDGVMVGVISNVQTSNLEFVLSGLVEPGSNAITFYEGFVDEVRLSKVARWTSGFTPPNKPYVR